MKIVIKGGSAEVSVSKSRFIANVFPAASADEAFAILADMKKKYWDARHNCHAFVIGPQNETAHSSDDGEPQGTAGQPILQVLTTSEVRNCLIIVTRYFGGVLLGTGGLIRAYTAAAKAGLDASTIAEQKNGYLLRIRCSYEQLGKVQYLIAASSLPVITSSYTDCCETQVLVSSSSLSSVKADLTEKTAGRVSFPGEDRVQYVTVSDGTVRDIQPLGNNSS